VTRKDFKLIADAVQAARSGVTKGVAQDGIATVNLVARSLAVHLGESNPRFDTQRFLAACGVTP
jgi:hypothetical protein